MDDLIQEFIAETREMLDALGGEIVAWEADPSERGRLDAIFRFVHTVKGNCGFFELPRLEALSHAAEDALSDVRSGRREPDSRLVSAVLAVLDRIGEMVAALEAGEEFAGSGDAALIEALSEHADADVEAAPVAAPAGTRAQPLRTIRLSVDLLDRMMSGVSDLVLARNELTRRLRETPADAGVHTAFEAVSTNIAEMREAITRTRMQRLENLFVALPRMVRDLAAELGKQVVVDIEGGDVELDREMIEMIRDPLTHIIRNSVDHGIEMPDVRRAAGKREIGVLNVCARQSGNQILIEVADDGRGIDGDKLVARAIAAGVLDAAAATQLSPVARNALVFGAGVSTAEAVTAISGRGVGMDVVRANVERIGGVVDLESRLGFGTRVTLRVPLTLTIIPALIVSVGTQTFAIPRSTIEEIVRANGEGIRIEQVGGANVAQIRGRRIPELVLGELIGVPMIENNPRTLIVLKPAGGDLYALAVDKVHDHEELVVKPAAPAIMASGLYAGTTLADNGRPILLLDAAGLAAAGGIVNEAGNQQVPVVAAPAAEAPRALLFRGLDGVKRVVRLAVVDRIEEVAADAVQFAAGRLRVRLGDRIVDLAGCDGHAVDTRLRLFRMSDGAGELAYGFAEVVDIVSFDGAFSAAPVPGPIAGVTLMNGEQIEVIDPHWLFAQHMMTRGHAQTQLSSESGTQVVAAPLCVLPAGDPWMDNMLRPMIETAGYRVVIGGSEDDAAGAVAVFRAVGDVAPASENDARTILLRSVPDDGGDGSLYRYDRAGVLGALAQRAAGGFA